MNRTLVALGVAIVLSLSCAGEKSRPAETAAVDETVPRDGGTILRRLESDVTSLNPVMAANTYDRRVANFLFAPLLNLDANLKPIAGVADTWEVSPDGKRYTFHLNPNATFSDRTPVRASDVLFTVKKITDPATEAAQLAGSFEQIDLPNCAVKDDHTIVLAFKDALASQLIQFNNLPVLPERVYNRPDFKTAFSLTAVGSGPYRLVRRVPGKEILMERREDYWATKPHIKSVLWKVVVDFQTALNAVKRGELDESMITSDMWARESARPELARTIEFRRAYTLNYNFVGWNTRDPLFTDKRVRHALAMCVDLRSIINNLYRGTARAMSGPFTPDQWAYNPAVPVIEFDPPGARRLLASMGWLDSDGDGIVDHDKKPFSFDLVVAAGTPVTLEFAQLYQAGLKEAGVNMNIVVVDPSVFFQRVFSGNYQATYMNWELDPDPDPFALFHSSQIPPHGQNFVYYSNPEVDRLLEEGRRTLDVSKRIPIYQRLHQLLADDQPYTTTVQVSVKYAVRKRVRNVKDSKGWGILQWYPGEFDWWLADDARQRPVREQ